MEENYNKQIGLRIKALRESKNEYQKETAKAITDLGEPLSEGQLGLYEIGIRKIPPNILKALAIHFNTTSDYLLGRKDIANNINKKIEDNNIRTAASSSIDLAKYAQLDSEKQKFVDKQMNEMIDIFLKEKKNK